MRFGFDVPTYVKELDLDRARLTLDDVAASGAKVIRCGVQPWFAEAKHLAHMRAVLDHARTLGLKVLFVTAQLANNPDETWERALEKNLAYIGTVADALGDRPDWWQVLNEWDAGDWILRGQPVPTGDDLPQYLARTGEMLAAARRRIKQAAPSVKVLTTITGTWCNDGTEARWREIYDGPVSKAVDLIGLNAYPVVDMRAYDELPQRLARISARYGKDVVICEFGLPSVGEGREFTEEHRGFYLVAQMGAIAKCPRVQAAFMYQWRDRTDVTGSEARFGITGKASKPAVDAFLRAHA